VTRPPETVVHLVRHGEVHNPTGVLYGRLPGFVLSPLGEEMAKVSAASLAGHHVTHLVTSPMERARQTAVPFAEQFGLEPVVDERLIESANLFEGKRVSDGRLFHLRHWWKLRDPFTPSWGEPYVEVATRMYAALLAARDAAEGHQAVCVSHQLPIWSLRRQVERKRLWHDPRQRRCALASVTSFYFQGTAIVGVGYDDPAAHLIAQSPTAQTERGA